MEENKMSKTSDKIPQMSGEVPETSGELAETSGEVPGTSTNVTKKCKARAKHMCPFPSCKSSVVHLPRHMMLSHGWSKEDARNVLSIFLLRKERVKPSKRQQHSKNIQCPVRKCKSVVKRIHNHLYDVHKFKPGSEIYKKWLSLAEPHDVITISSESSMSVDSTSSESVDESAWKKINKNTKKKSKKQSFTSKDVYPSSSSSSEESSVHSGNYKGSKSNTACKQSYPIASMYKKESESYTSKSKKKERTQQHPSIFKNDSESDDDSESSERSDDPESHEIPGEDQHQEESPIEYVPSPLPGAHTGVNEDSRSESGSDSEAALSDFYNEAEDSQDDQPPVPQLTNNELFQKFTAWLQGPDGGRKNTKCSLQCSRQVQSVAAAINPESPKVSDLFDRKILRDSWLTKFEKEKQPGTVKSYLGSLNLFFTFLKCEQLGQQYGVAHDQLGVLSDQMKQWNKSYRNLVKHRFWVKRMEDLANLKTPQHVQEFDRSQLSRDAVRIIGESQDEKKVNGPTHQEYTSVRDYLLTIICINNGSRSGSLANMTLEEFQNAHQDGDDYVVKVKKHKTFTTHGPAHIVMPTTIYTWLGIFVSNFRNKLGEVDKGDNAPVFLSWNLHPMNSSHIGKQMGSCWGKVFGKEASGGGATAFRKAAVSAVHEHDEEARGNLASLMDHRKETADKFYLLQQKSKQATVAARSLRRIMHSRKCNETQAAATPHRWTAEQEKF